MLLAVPTTLFAIPSNGMCSLISSVCFIFAISYTASGY